jgi:hypothetical protein
MSVTYTKFTQQNTLHTSIKCKHFKFKNNNTENIKFLIIHASTSKLTNNEHVFIPLFPPFPLRPRNRAPEC